MTQSHPAAACILAAALACPLAAQTDAAAPPAVPSSLAAILEGGVPKTLADLRAMEQHNKDLLRWALKRTVTCNGASGVIVEGGLVLTCAHVTRTAGRPIPIILNDGTRLSGRSLGLNHRTDAGLVKIDGTEEEVARLPRAAMGKVADLEVGQWVAMLGQTGGRKSWRDPPLRVGRLLRVPTSSYLVSDCTMAGGDSGGPLFDMQGRVIGINSRINQDLQTNMHVPIDAFHRDWERLLKGETIGTLPTARGTRGRGRSFDGGPVPGAVADPGVDGQVLVESVVPGSPAAKAGIRPGDVLLGYERSGRLRKLTTARALERPVYGFRAGDKVKVVIERGDTRVTVEVELAEVKKQSTPRRSIR